MNFLPNNTWGSGGSTSGLNLFSSLQQQTGQQPDRSAVEQPTTTAHTAGPAKRPSTSGTSAMEQLVMEVTSPATRERALLELSKKRESFQELAPYLWHSFGVTAALLQEVVSVYALLVPPAPPLSAPASNRVCNALALLQCVASHAETRSLFLQAHLVLYVYPFLNTTDTTRPFEYLRLTSLGVVGALVKVDDPHVINFLLATEFIPLCLRTMETGTELSKTVSTFILQKILLDDVGLHYICATTERFMAVSNSLAQMVNALYDQPSTRLLKHIIRCYLRLSDHDRAKELLVTCLPAALANPQLISCLKNDTATKRWLTRLLSRTERVEAAHRVNQTLPGMQEMGGMPTMP